MDKFSNLDESSNVVLRHCRSLERLLDVLQKPSPPRDEILELLKKNVQLFIAFIELETQSLVDDIPLNQRQSKQSHTNLYVESQNKNEVSRPLREPISLPSKRLDSLLGDERTTEDDEKPSKSSFDSVAGEPSDMINHALINLPPPPWLSSVVKSSTLNSKDSTLSSSSYSQPQTANSKKRRLSVSDQKTFPFKPTNANTKKQKPFNNNYFVAKHTFINGSVSCVVFVRDTLLLGDGYIYGVVHTMSNTLDHLFYNSCLSIPQLIAAVRRFPRLPENVCLSIGNIEALHGFNIYAVRRQYFCLLTTLSGLGVRRLHVLPLMSARGASASPHYNAVTDMLMSDWSVPFGGDYIFENDLIQDLCASDSSQQLPLRFEDNSLRALPKLWSKLEDAIRMRFSS